MCDECSPEIRKLARRIGIYTASHCWVTPGLHIVLDDNNHETHHIQWCLDTQELDEVGREIAAELLKLTTIERHGVQVLADEGSVQINGVGSFEASWISADGEPKGSDD